MRCATCGAELIEVGYAEDGFQYYRCPNDCEVIFSKFDRAVDVMRQVLFLVVLVLTIVIFSPLLITAAVANKVKRS